MKNFDIESIDTYFINCINDNSYSVIAKFFKYHLGGFIASGLNNECWRFYNFDEAKYALDTLKSHDIRDKNRVPIYCCYQIENIKLDIKNIEQRKLLLYDYSIYRNDDILSNLFARSFNLLRNIKNIINTNDRNTWEYILWRKQIFERDNYTCQKCKSYGGDLNAHHIKSFKEYINLRFDLNNGVTLCEKCHDDFHKLFGKKDFTEDQFNMWFKIKCA